MVQVIFSETADPQYLNLIFNEFFLSRNRGLALEAHFPWIRNSSVAASFAHLYEGDELIGGLVIKDSSHCMTSGYPKIASIGLVCVASKHRGEGLSKILLSAAIQNARDEKFGALTLWTSKWGVYQSLGFVIEDNSLYGWVNNPSGGSGDDSFNSPRNSMAIAREYLTGLPVPPFAESVIILRGVNTTCTLVTDGVTGPIVVAYTGEPDLVAAILKDELPERWRLNATSGDPILKSLSRVGMTVEMKAVNLQMWLPLDDTFTPAQLASMSRFTVLDRI